ncbi:MAG: hypothetical protein CFE35_12780 [Novosphingobium sp. PASSN1]|nr:MAG: hypothetical protein CFE35_12780 [Novosphingobium sp. PASSN1]
MRRGCAMTASDNSQTGKTMVPGSAEFVRFLVETGQKHVFGLPGSSMVAPLHQLQNTDIRFVPAIHESVAVAAADGYARVAGSATTLLYMLPGLANGLANLYNAWRDETPLTVIASQQASYHRSLGSTIGEGDLVAMTRPFTRLSHEIAPGMSLRFWLEKARSVASGALPGPVFLSIPEDVLEGMVEQTSFRQSAAPSPAIPNVSAVAEALALAQRPLIVVGGQLRRFGGSRAIEDLAAAQGIALAYEPGFADRLGVAPGHPNCFGNILFAPALERTADVVIFLGARFLLEAHPKPSWFPQAQWIAHINADPLKLEETKKADWAAAADPGAFAAALAGAVGANGASAGLVDARRSWLSSLREGMSSAEMPRGQSSYLRAITPLHDALDHGWLVDESVMGIPVVQGVLRATDGHRYMGTTGASLGWGTGAAAGVALASGEPATCVIGDGSLRFGALGLWTLRNENLPVTLIVLDNGGYGSTRYFERQYIQRLGPAAVPQGPGYLGSDFRESGSSVEGIIAGFGIPVAVVEQDDDPRRAIEHAWSQAHAGPNAVVIRMDFGD